MERSRICIDCFCRKMIGFGLIFDPGTDLLKKSYHVVLVVFILSIRLEYSLSLRHRFRHHGALSRTAVERCNDLCQEENSLSQDFGVWECLEGRRDLWLLTPCAVDCLHLRSSRFEHNLKNCFCHMCFILEGSGFCEKQNAKDKMEEKDFEMGVDLDCRADVCNSDRASFHGSTCGNPNVLNLTKSYRRFRKRTSPQSRRRRESPPNPSDGGGDDEESEESSESEEEPGYKRGKDFTADLDRYFKGKGKGPMPLPPPNDCDKVKEDPNDLLGGYFGSEKKKCQNPKKDAKKRMKGRTISEELEFELDIGFGEKLMEEEKKRQHENPEGPTEPSILHLPECPDEDDMAPNNGPGVKKYFQPKSSGPVSCIPKKKAKKQDKVINPDKDDEDDVNPDPNAKPKPKTQPNSKPATLKGHYSKKQDAPPPITQTSSEELESAISGSPMQKKKKEKTLSEEMDD